MKVIEEIRGFGEVKSMYNIRSDSLVMMRELCKQVVMCEAKTWNKRVQEQNL